VRVRNTHRARRGAFNLEVVDKADRPILPPAEFVDKPPSATTSLPPPMIRVRGYFPYVAETAELDRRVLGDTIAINGRWREYFVISFCLVPRITHTPKFCWSFYSQFASGHLPTLFDRAFTIPRLDKKVIDPVCGESPRFAPRWRMALSYVSVPQLDGRFDISLAGSCIGSTGMPYLERSITPHTRARSPLH